MHGLDKKSRNMGSRKRKGEADKQVRAAAAIDPLTKRRTFNERDAERTPLPWPGRSVSLRAFCEKWERPSPQPATTHCILVPVLRNVKSRGGILRGCFLVASAWGRGARARGQAPVARFHCNFNFRKPFWFIVRGVVRSDFASGRVIKKRVQTLFLS